MLQSLTSQSLNEGLRIPEFSETMPVACVTGPAQGVGAVLKYANPHGSLDRSERPDHPVLF